MLAMPLILPLTVLIEIYVFVLWYSLVVFQDYCRMLLPADAATRRRDGGEQRNAARGQERRELRGGRGDRRRRRRLGPSCSQDDAKNKAKNYDIKEIRDGRHRGGWGAGSNGGGSREKSGRIGVRVGGWCGGGSWLDLSVR